MSQVTPDQLKALLSYASKRLGTTPEQLEKTVTEGNLSALAGRLDPENAAKLNAMTADRSKAVQLLQSPRRSKRLPSSWETRNQTPRPPGSIRDQTGETGRGEFRMDDLNKKISDLLGSPDGMARIQSMMEALGIGGDGGESAPVSDSPIPAPAPETASPPPAAPAASGGGMPDLSALLKLAPLMGNLNKDDENTALLKALRPYLHGDREKRLDDAIQILRIMKVLPLIQEKGLF